MRFWIPVCAVVLASASLFPATSQAAGKIYRCTTEDGAVTFSNTMCSPSAPPPSMAAASSVSAPPAEPRIQEIPHPLPRTMAEVDRACQVQSQDITVRYARELAAVDSEAIAIAREGRAATAAGKARLVELDGRRWDIDRQARAAQGAMADRCSHDRQAVRASLATAR